MTVFSVMLRLIDRELVYWGKPVFTMLAGALPIVALDPFFDGPPSASPLEYFVPALLICVAWEAIVFWKYMKFEIKKFRDLRALGAQEEAAKNDA